MNAEHHAAAIADLRRRRTRASVGVKLVRSALTDFTASLGAQIAGALKELYAISHRSLSVYGFTAGEAARIAIEQIAAAYEKGRLSDPAPQASRENRSPDRNHVRRLVEPEASRTRFV